ncbi:MAG: GIY-YIG nuclease family protein [Bacteroidota bacterium]
MFYTYILISESNQRYYVGHTHNLKERLKYHNDGRVRSTKNKGPWKIVYFEKYISKLEANRRELEIKKKKSRKYIEKLIDEKRK